MTDDALTMWTIYDHPRDFPHFFVAREWTVERGRDKPSGAVILSETLHPLRATMAREGRTCCGREADDDPVIVEAWV